MNLWSTFRDLLIVIPYKDQQDLSTWSSEVKKLREDSKFRKLELMVCLPKGTNKVDFENFKELTFVSDKDFGWFGKIKDQKLNNKLIVQIDVVFGFGLKDDAYKILKRLQSKSKIAINCNPDKYWDISLSSNSLIQADLISFAKNTLTKISTHE